MADRVGEVPGSASRSTTWVRGRPNAREIRALISLLGDESQRVVGMVWENLLRLGPRSLPYLVEVHEHADPRLRFRARTIIARIQAEQLERRFRQLAASGEADFDLEYALGLVAQIEYPNFDASAVAQELEELADALRPQLPSDAPARAKVERLIEFLFHELGFRGNRKTYYDPDNSCMHRVLELRRGSPVSLSALMILVGRRLGLPLYGVGLPKHFLVKYQDANTEIFIDPFNGGRILSRLECREILTSEGYYVRESFVTEYLAIASARDIVIRTLRSLILIYSKLDDRTRVRRLIRYVDLLRLRRRAR
jgi:regulator of sirC expression with transglutaminase-like and TPR domain